MAAGRESLSRKCKERDENINKHPEFTKSSEKYKFEEKQQKKSSVKQRNLQIQKKFLKKSPNKAQNILIQQKCNELINSPNEFNAFSSHLKECMSFNGKPKSQVDLYIKNSWMYLINQRLRMCKNGNTLDDYTHMDDKFGKHLKNIRVKKKCSNVIHIPWCSVCGKTGLLKECETCCISFHKTCSKREPTITINNEEMLLLKELERLCPSCLYKKTLGPGDIVWHKLKTFPWWPARILNSDQIPSSLRSRPSPEFLPVKYYSSENYAWAEVGQICDFNINYDCMLKKNNEYLQKAISLAEDDTLINCK